MTALNFADALAVYRARRAASDVLPDDHADVDEALDAYCDAMDKAIETPVGGLGDLDTKLKLITERCQGLADPDDDDVYVFGSYWRAIVADVAELAGAA